jgi:hypothetical protein
VSVGAASWNTTCQLRQHTPAYVRICQDTSGYVRIRQLIENLEASAGAAHVRIRQDTSVYVRIRQLSENLEASAGAANWNTTCKVVRRLVIETEV